MILDGLDYTNGKGIANELFDLGIECENTNTIESASIITHFFKLHNAKDFLRLPKAIKILEIITGKRIVKSETAPAYCFGLEFDKDEREFLALEDYMQNLTPYNLLVGKTTDNAVFKVDLDETPHLLISGCTGSGKSVLLNNFVKCLLAKNEFLNYYLPVIIDTKRVGFGQYNGKHGTQVATTTQEALQFLKALVLTMDERYEEMQRKHLTKWQGTRIVIIIDEFADLVMQAKKRVEYFVSRIAQLGRACGIHLIIATQRPTANIITGVIRANIADRIALKVATSLESRVIIEQSGAEKLKGKGDCIVKINGDTKRVQCFFSK